MAMHFKVLIIWFFLKTVKPVESALKWISPIKMTLDASDPNACVRGFYLRSYGINVVNEYRVMDQKPDDSLGFKTAWGDDDFVVRCDQAALETTQTKQFIIKMSYSDDVTTDVQELIFDIKGTAVDECASGTDECAKDATCIDTTESYVCQCKKGYSGNGKVCQDTNECSDGTADCSTDANCINTAGSYECQCKDGYSGDGKVCQDTNECSDGTDDCSTDANCINTAGSYECHCKEGYSGDGKVCQDTNECSDGTDDCSTDANCINTAGSYECQCKKGYSGDGKVCQDTNECSDGTDDCSTDANCINTAGSYECHCKEGYSGDGKVCQDTNECSDGTADCSTDANCINTAGSYECQCKKGYSGDGKVCQDINECDTGTDDCSPGANCINTVGSFECECKDGFSGDGVICQDIHECGIGADDCSKEADCTNTVGSYECQCKGGYSGDGKVCQDVNECSTGAGKCSVGANCLNTVGSYMCQCKDGYSGDGEYCEEIDECTIGTDDCSPNANCINTAGSFECQCKGGYDGNGQTCTDTDECDTGVAQCSLDATCINTAGSFECQCHDGYRGNGVVCEDINECTVGTDGCSKNANCINTIGSFQCQCNTGYSGNGIICRGAGHTCQDILNKNEKARTGTYILDPDGDGPLKAVKVHCIMEDGIAITELKPVRTKAKLFNSKKNEFIYKYKQSVKSIKAIISNSEFCYQEMSFTSSDGRKLLDGDDYWVNGNCQKEYTWGGATVAGKCACGQIGYCENNSESCNCDGSSSKRSDSGKILDKSKLPIRKIVSGGNVGTAHIQIGKVRCANKPIDLPTTCHQAKFGHSRHDVSENGPQVVDFDGADGPLSPVLVHCDMETYSHVGVTVIPHSMKGAVTADNGENKLDYIIDDDQLVGLIAASTFCSQEVQYKCMRSSIATTEGAQSYFSDVAGNVKDYWPGGESGKAVCGCELFNSCKGNNQVCNCNGETNSEDGGQVIDKADLPIGSLTFTDISATSTGILKVSELKCSQFDFGIKASCKDYFEADTEAIGGVYWIDPDGPDSLQNETLPPYLAKCDSPAA